MSKLKPLTVGELIAHLSDEDQNAFIAVSETGDSFTLIACEDWLGTSVYLEDGPGQQETMFYANAVQKAGGGQIEDYAGEVRTPKNLRKAVILYGSKSENYRS